MHKKGKITNLTYTQSSEGSDDENPLTVKKLKEILSVFNDADEIGSNHDHAHQNTYIEVEDDYFDGDKKDIKFIRIYSH